MNTLLKKIKRGKLKTLQVNLGNLCNQRCRHCHIDAGPDGKDMMPLKAINDILHFLSQNKGLILDITGGAPELHPDFAYLVRSAKPYAKEIIVRSNLTVYFEPGKDYLPAFFKENNVRLICSLPCYTKENTDSQRGMGVFEKSIKAMRILNDLGYGKINGLYLDLVHNPDGINLPPAQDKLEAQYKDILNRDYNIVFNRLITITNVTIKRFKNYLDAEGKYEKYTNLLKDSFNEKVLENLMCRAQLSVGWDGKLYDCDFNLALGLELTNQNGRALSIDALNLLELDKKEINFLEHCFACTAGSGSSCQGALAASKDTKMREEVKSFYSDAAVEPKRALCCPWSYEKEDISFIPKEVLEVSYGCGSPMSLACPQAGDIVVDLGCGAGIDCFIAAKKAGITGKVIGIDMTDEMLNKARLSSEEVAQNLGFLNCEFRQGYLEDMPVESETVDLVTSNCVVNLSYDKRKVFSEIYRILKNGGRFVISDIVSEKKVPVGMKNNKKLWGECISGALTEDEFLTIAAENGFYELEIMKSFLYREIEGIKFHSITVCGYKLKKQKITKTSGEHSRSTGCCCAPVKGKNSCC